ncbi:hypothetical protein BpHYR1_006573 [Brachionus plicatilis]|uniref:Uncharacterized protein n=1 Tax=Brachionus plicatilis TaxID=10195 RepID=A0A3M7QCI6_BRAPC|nr:hypothetical protein BpHYR1_006573 [Brachionus plicatilis]
MYLFPNTAIPTVATASVTAYPTSLLLNSLEPSIVYERYIGTPVFPNFVPLVGIKCKEKTKNKEYIDDFIKKRVDEELKENQNRRENLKKNFVYNSCHCNCNKSRGKKELTLDEKIERIREELNLTKETNEIKLVQNLHDFEEDIINPQKIDNKQTNDFKKHHKINHDEVKFDFSCTNLKKEKKSSRIHQVVNNAFESKFGKTSNQSTLDAKIQLIHQEPSLSKQNFEDELEKKLLEYQTRNEQATKRHQTKEKFEPPTAHRSHWIPTGSNDYSHTNSKRGDLLKKQQHSVPLNSEPSAYFYHKNPTKDKSSILTVETYIPAQTIYETTVVNRPISSCYVLDESKKPFKINRTFFSVAKEYCNHPVRRSKTFCI